MLRFMWKQLIRRVAPRHLDALAGRRGRPDWPVMLRRGLTHGFLGGSNVWLVLGAIAALVRFSQRIGEGRGDVVLVEQLGRGEGLSIVDTAIERKRDGR
ncbi:MAG: hypothetical protein AVDCRST_MAG76-269 [uncultured Acidimicrobiales bacterium]|uniref:Uncharacterized protein n=1 Tax=uncultured Acidimicrobiales bacterium TaxID=310071 RepID=A0A6J4H4N0_9ACTN|nr:MAG: hypothetical protein AVDCRST_MAG76-269 [uncultured Acidimicrobiales bacterium]